MMMGAILTAIPGLQTFAAGCAKPTFFGLVPWYQYLTLDANCSVTNFNSYTNSNNVIGGNSPFLLIGLAVLDDLIRIAALVAVGFVITGGIKYVTSQGSPDATSNAQQTITNALIGLVLAVMAASLVAFLGNKIGAPSGS
jgi:hypothetical protein